MCFYIAIHPQILLTVKYVTGNFILKFEVVEVVHPLQTMYFIAFVTLRLCTIAEQRRATLAITNK